MLVLICDARRFDGCFDGFHVFEDPPFYRYFAYSLYTLSSSMHTQMQFVKPYS